MEKVRLSKDEVVEIILEKFFNLEYLEGDEELKEIRDTMLKFDSDTLEEMVQKEFEYEGLEIEIMSEFETEVSKVGNE